LFFRIKYTFILLLSLTLAVTASEWIGENYLQSTALTKNKPQTLAYKVINTFPHDPDAYTQGLVFKNDFLYEGTGINGKSSIRKVAIKTGTVKQIKNLDKQYFGEGITIVADKLLQLSYISKIGFIYDLNSFEQTGTFSYPTQGWGLTYDGQRLIVSDGTAKLYFYHPLTMQPLGSISVFDHQGEVSQLNELEFINGQIFANILPTNRIVRINPNTGQITASVDLSGLLSPAERKTSAVLNGIAYDQVNNSFFVTGKNWPKLFEIELLPIKTIKFN
jgi:glutaminyl-peptide cyclotransferase